MEIVESMSYKDIVIVVPAYEPDVRMLDLLRTIRQKESEKLTIVLVDDGSGLDYAALFDEAKNRYDCTVLTHDVNKGKGCAIKTAISYVLESQEVSRMIGMVTIDADGQHTYEDTIKCMDAFLINPESLVLGVRTFQKNIPFRSRFGNVLTRDVLGAFTGMSISDTQTGLRVIPFSWLSTLLDLEGERYEFEMNMLLEAQKDHMPIHEVGIETIYIEDNESSHFHAIRDSIRIYSVFLKYVASSLFCFFVDIFAFSFLMSLLGGLNFASVTIASFVARIISSVTNFLINHKVVFKEGNDSSAIGYFALVLIQILISSLFVAKLGQWWISLPISLIKVVVDALLILASYHVQKRFIFKGENK